MLRDQILGEMSASDLTSGNPKEGMKFREAWAASVDDPGRLIGRLSALARMYALFGQFDAADESFERANRQFEILLRYRLVSSTAWWDRWGLGWRTSISRVKAAILASKGKYTEADQEFRAVLRNMASDPVKFRPRGRARAQLGFTRNLVRQGRLIEAEIEARELLKQRLTTLGKNSPETVLAIGLLSGIFTEQGRVADAEQLYRAGLETGQSLGMDVRSLVMRFSRAGLAESLVAQERWAEANEEFVFLKVHAESRHVDFNLNWALTLIRMGSPEQGLSIAQRANQKRKERLGESHYDTAEAKGIAAVAVTHMNDKRRALALFRESVPVLLSFSSPTDKAKTKFLQDQRQRIILETYVHLLSQIRGTELEREADFDAVDVAFTVSDFAQSRSVQRAITASSSRATIDNPELADLARRAQDAQNQIDAHLEVLAKIGELPAQEQDKATIERLTARLQNLDSAREALSLAIKKRFPRYADLIGPQPLSLAETQALVRPDEALISVYVSDRATYVWVIPHAGEIAFYVVPLNSVQVARQVAHLRESVDPATVAQLGDIPEFDTQSAFELYQALLEPGSPIWRNASTLVVVANGALGQIPFSMLVTDIAKIQPPTNSALFAEYKEVSWLGRSHAIMALPSATSLASLRSRPREQTRRRPFIGFGDPNFSHVKDVREPPREGLGQSARRMTRGQTMLLRRRAFPRTRAVDSAKLSNLPRLPDTADEIVGIASALGADPGRDVFLGLDANEQSVKSIDLSRYQVVAFATHGLVPGDLDGLVQPALALSSPIAAGVTGDGLLTLGEVLRLKLNADWVVLSACNTASAEGAGADAVSGLGRAFFYAGTKALLVSHWPVETTSARVLTTDLFRRWANDPGIARSKALLGAMVGMIDGPGFIDPNSGEIVFSYAHPIFWAPFSLVGDGGAERPDT